MKKGLVVTLIMLTSCLSYNLAKGQSVNDNLNLHFYDRDTLLYKKIIISEGQKDTLYFDLNGKQRSLSYFKGENEGLNFLLNKFKRPKGYPKLAEFGGVISFIIEPDSTLSNLRIISGFERRSTKRAIGMFRYKGLKKLPPYFDGENYIASEFRSFFWVPTGGMIHPTIKQRRKLKKYERKRR